MDAGNHEGRRMTGRPTPLPPLQTLRAFEAAGRLASFTRAAHELNITQGAISRQIRHLEERLGVRLFRRGDRAIALSEAGARYHRSIAEALERIAAATAELGVHSGRGPVTIGASSALASLWLMPRLTGFRRREPDLDIRVLAADYGLPAADGEADVLITYARGEPRGEDVRHLFDEVIFAVAAPDLMAEGEVPTTPRQLLDHTLLVLDDDHPDWINWPGWFARCGVPAAQPRRSIRINSYPMLLQAAVAGQGIALGWRHLVDDLVTAGSLELLPIPALQTEGGFYLLSQRRFPAASPAGRLRDWLADSGADMAVAPAPSG